MTRWIVTIAAAAALAAGCARTPELKPAPSAQGTDQGDAKVSVQQAGVELIVDGGAWDGFPEDLDSVVPVKVTIRNNSGEPLRLRYSEFQLVTDRGQRLQALPPLQIDATEAVGVGGAGLDPFAPTFTYSGFHVAPHVAPFYTGLDPWAGPFALAPYGDAYRMWPVELPTSDMIASALPEGVLRPGGSVSGFIFFEDVPDGAERVTFRADLVNAESAEEMGQVQIPFIPEDA